MPRPPQKFSLILSLLYRLRYLPHFARLFWRLFRDRRVPAYLKVMVVLTVLYVLSPVDFLPDYLPLVGQLDDLSLLLFVGYYFIQWSPSEVVREHLDVINRAR
jgi:uncharacterized membrane protein YkvA (DUF1232 family)